jgi:hypothetical protein
MSAWTKTLLLTLAGCCIVCGGYLIGLYLAGSHEDGEDRP